MASNKLSAKAARLDFSGLPGAFAPKSAPAPGAPAVVGAPGAGADTSGSPPEPANRPKTAPGAMMAFANDARSELMRENDDLRTRAAAADELRGKLDDALTDLQQWDGAKAARLIDARQIIASRFANRHELGFSSPEFAQLKAEIESAGGNVQPIKVRSTGAGGAGLPMYELVFGHRRHRACLELGLPVLAVIDNLEDRALFVEMERENRSRKDLSAWEQGTMYRRALQLGLFPSNRKLAEAVGVDLSALGKALALAELPEAVVAAFASPLDLQFRWSKALHDALAADPAGINRRAAAFAAQRGSWTARQVFDALVAAPAVGVEPFHPPAPIRIELNGQVAATVSMQAAGGVSVSIGPGLVKPERLAGLAQAIEAFLVAPAAKSR